MQPIVVVVKPNYHLFLLQKSIHYKSLSTMAGEFPLPRGTNQEQVRLHQFLMIYYFEMTLSFPVSLKAAKEADLIREQLQRVQLELNNDDLIDYSLSSPVIDQQIVKLCRNLIIIFAIGI